MSTDAVRFDFSRVAGVSGPAGVPGLGPMISVPLATGTLHSGLKTVASCGLETDDHQNIFVMAALGLKEVFIGHAAPCSVFFRLVLDGDTLDSFGYSMPSVVYTGFSAMVNYKNLLYVDPGPHVIELIAFSSNSDMAINSGQMSIAGVSTP